MKFLFSTLFTLGLIAEVFASDVPQPTAHFPKFSWDTVPVYFHFGKREASLTPSEIKFVAKRSNFIGFEKLHGSGPHGSTEAGTAFDVKRLKEANPDLKALFYWNSFINYGGYEANDEFRKNEDWVFRDENGEAILKKEAFRQFNILNPEFQEWWSDVAGRGVTDFACDGVFVDAVLQPKRGQWMRLGWGMGREAELDEAIKSMMTLAKQKMGEQSLLVYNGIRSSDTDGEYLGEQFLGFSDGTNLEHLAVFNSQSKESIAADIEMIAKAGKAGKIVIVKGWPDPDFNWTNGPKMRENKKQLAAEATDQMEFPLACFLVAAQEYSYFCYSWGYQAKHGSLVNYPQFKKPLGAPKGDAVKTGWEYRRSFAHADVWVNIETQEAKIDWK